MLAVEMESWDGFERYTGIKMDCIGCGVVKRVVTWLVPKFVLSNKRADGAVF